MGECWIEIELCILSRIHTVSERSYQHCFDVDEGKKENE